MRTKNYLLLFTFLFCLTGTSYAQDKATVVINADLGKKTINRHIYGHFSEHLGHCIYGGIWVGEDSPIPNTKGIRNDVLAALKELNIPNLRWPGGCFADEYHWMDGIGPRSERPKMINTHWGGVVEDNSFGTHEFLTLCELLETEPYICGNVGSGTVEEMAKWVEYITFDGESPMANLRRKNGRDKPWKVKFWGVGNENWGCGGHMSAEGYAEHYRRYATYCRNYSDNSLERIAGGPVGTDFHWMETMMKNIPAHLMTGVSLHNYTMTGKNWEQKGSATVFTEDEYIHTLDATNFMDKLIADHAAIMDKYDPDKKIGLMVDEWGAWYDAEPGTNPGFLFQQNSLRDAIAAAVALNIFNKHCDRVQMTNIAQTVNVLQAMIFTDNEKMLLTPTYHVFNMYKVHQDATWLPLDINCPKYTKGTRSVESVSATASKDKNGAIHITLVNVNPSRSMDISCQLHGAGISKVTGGQLITSGNLTDHNTFEKPDKVKMVSFSDAKYKNGELTVKIPAKSIVTIELK